MARGNLSAGLAGAAMLFAIALWISVNGGEAGSGALNSEFASYLTLILAAVGLTLGVIATRLRARG